MPDTTDCVGFRFPLDTDQQNTAADLAFLAQQMDDAICGASTDIDQLKTDVNNRVRKAGDTMTGTLIANATGAGIDVRRAGNQPLITFGAHPSGTPRYGYVMAEGASGMRYNADDANAYHRWIIGTTEQMRLSPGGVLDVNQVRTDVALTAGNGNGGQIRMVDLLPVAAAPTIYASFYSNGTVAAPGTRVAYVGFPGNTSFYVNNELGGDTRIQTAGGGDILLLAGTSGTVNIAPAGATRAMAIGSNFLFGKTTPGNLDLAGVDIACAGVNNGQVRSTVSDIGYPNFVARHEGGANANDSWFYQCVSAAGSSQGGIVGVSSTGVRLQTTSDYRLKEDRGLIPDALARLMELPARRFLWRADPQLGEQEGFFAHEVASVVPGAVSGELDATNEDGSIDPQMMDASALIPLLVGAIQELALEVAELKERCCG